MTAPNHQRTAATRVIAVVQAAGRRIGVAGEHVVQAVVVPADLGAVPRRAGAIAGVITLAGQMVPVVRLQDWLPAEDEPPATGPSAADARIVILRSGDVVVGLLVDAVIGMRRCAADAVARLFHDERAEELFDGAVRLDADAPPLPLLEPARLAALAGVWCEAAGLRIERAQDAGDAPAGGCARRVGLGVFRIGDLLVALPASDIGELLVTPALRAPPMRQPTTRGLCDWRDRLLPVADIAALLGALPAAHGGGWMCVVRHAGMVLGVLVDEIVELHGALLPDAASEAGEAGALVRCELPTSHGIVQVLDTAALMARCPESAISRRSQIDAAPHQQPVTSPHTYLVFEAAGPHAACIDCVQEILPLPDAVRPRLEAGLAVSLAWRGHAVPVRGLHAGQGLAAAEARLLLVVADERRVAIPIAAVKAMIAPHTATLARLRVQGALLDVVSTAASASDRATYELVDLAALAALDKGLRQAA